MKSFVAHIDVEADLATGWRVLTDFERYPAWNPLLRRVKGACAEGESLRLRVAKTLGSDKTVPLPARIRVCTPETELSWGGGIPGLLDVHHYFRLTALPTGPDQTAGFRFTHGEDFQGPMLSLLWPLVGSRIHQRNYTALNEAFKARCEAVLNLRE